MDRARGRGAPSRRCTACRYDGRPHRLMQGSIIYQKGTTSFGMVFVFAPLKATATSKLKIETLDLKSLLISSSHCSMSS
jgi:hypothetical protein